MLGSTDSDPPHRHLKGVVGQLIILAMLLLIGFLVCPIELLSSDDSDNEVVLVEDSLELSLIGLNTLRPVSSVYFLDEKKESLPEPILRPDTEPRTILALITAYNATVEQCDSTPFITASGERVREGIVACPIWLPFDSLIEIDGKMYECQDRMGFAHQNANKFDIFMFSEQRAIQFGRQTKQVIIY